MEVDLLQLLPTTGRICEVISMNFITGITTTERQHNAVFTFCGHVYPVCSRKCTKLTIDALGAARLYYHAPDDSSQRSPGQWVDGEYLQGH